MIPRKLGEWLLLLVLISTVGMITSCTYYVGRMANYVTDPPEPAPQPPEISNASLSPAQIQAGTSTPVMITFQYTDWNGDVGPGSADVELTLTKVLGNFNITQPMQKLTGTVQQKSGTYGREGMVTVTKDMSASSGARGVVSVSVALFDQAGHKSQQLNAGSLSIVSKWPPPPPPPGGCYFTDASGTPRSSFRVGQQIFFRVHDPDNDISSGVDQLRGAVTIQNPHTGDFEVITLVETGNHTGTFWGPAGRLIQLVSPTGRPIPNDGRLEVFDNDTIMGQYTDPNDPTDSCIAVAKVG